KSMEYHIAPILTVCHEIIPLIVKNQLIWTYNLIRRFMEFLIYFDLIVIVCNTELLFNSSINQFNVIEQCLVICFTPIVNRMNVSYTRAEVFVGKSAQPINQVFGVLCRNMLAAQNTVNQHMQLGILKLAAFQITAGSARFYFNAGFFQQ